MALFKRNKKESVMPEEVQNFYAAERRQRKGTAWLLALATLIITFLIASALFFGGRWVFRTIFSNDDKATTSQNESSEEKKAEEERSETNTPASLPGDQSDAPTNGAAGQNGTTASPNSGTTGTVPATGPNELVNTGPGDE